MPVCTVVSNMPKVLSSTSGLEAASLATWSILVNFSSPAIEYFSWLVSYFAFSSSALVMTLFSSSAMPPSTRPRYSSLKLSTPTQLQFVLTVLKPILIEPSKAKNSKITLRGEGVPSAGASVPLIPPNSMVCASARYSVPLFSAKT